jgi:hypothetical protein
MKILTTIALITLLAGCAGRSEPEGSFFDPVCMPDGSVALRQLATEKGDFGTPRAKREYCPWNKAAK